MVDSCQWIFSKMPIIHLFLVRPLFMGKWSPCKRRDFIRKLRKFGFQRLGSLDVAQASLAIVEILER
jgi:hypothetical protein